MMLLETLYLWLYTLIYLLIHKFFPHTLPYKTKWAIRNTDAWREFTWLEIARKKVPIVNVIIGPYISWPDIQQTFRFIRKYNIPVILTIDGKDATWNNDSHEFADAFKNWLITLLNRFEIPKEVFVYQILDKNFSSSTLPYSVFLESFIGIDQENINPINRNKIIQENLGNRCSGQAFDILAMKKLKNYFFSIDIEPIPYTLLAKWKWALYLFRQINYMFELRLMAPTKQFFLIDLHKETHIDILLSCLLVDKIFEHKLGAIVFKDMK
jgi:hypothetical protein